MSVIDERGRLFGRVNLIDAIVAIVLLGLIPLAYGAFVLFRVPMPKVSAITPSQVAEHQQAILQITGENLRPFLDVRFGPFASNGFLVQSPTYAEVKLPDLPAGTYDFTLSDGGQTLVRIPGALTVSATQAMKTVTQAMKTELQALGAFVGLSDADARLLRVGLEFGPQTNAPPVVQVLTVGAVEPATRQVKVGATAFVTVPLTGEFRVPAVIRLRCSVVGAECKIGDTVVAQTATIVLPASAGSRAMAFTIDEVRSTDARPTRPSVRSSALATLRVRFVASPEVLDVMKVGDLDVAGSGKAPELGPAVLTEIGSDRQTTSAQLFSDALRRSLQVEQPVLTFTGTVRVPVVYTSTGWSYRERPVKVGATFAFETVSGVMSGWIVDMTFGSGNR